MVTPTFNAKPRLDLQAMTLYTLGVLATTEI